MITIAPTPMLLREFSVSPERQLTADEKICELFMQKVRATVENSGNTPIHNELVQMRDREVIHDAFMQILGSGMGLPQKAKLIDQLLAHPSIADGTILEVFNEPTLFPQLNKTVLLNALKDVKKIPIRGLIMLASQLTDVAHVKQLVEMSWKENAYGPFKTLLNRFTPPLVQSLVKLVVEKEIYDLEEKIFLLSSLGNDIPDTVMDLLKPFSPPLHASSNPKKLLNRLLNNVVTIQLKNGQLNSNIIQHLESLTPKTIYDILDFIVRSPTPQFEEPFLRNRHVIECIFRAKEPFPAQTIEHLVSIDFLNIDPIREEFFHLSYLYMERILNFANQWIRAPDSPNIFASALTCVIDYLDTETTLILREKLDRLKNSTRITEDQEDELDFFINEIEEKSLIGWSYKYPEEARNFNWLFKGSQDGKDGFTNLPRASQILTVLNLRAPPTVTFDEEQLDNYLLGGTCSAMTLSFLKEFLAARTTAPDALSAIQTIAPRYKNSSYEFRTTQSAYNTISKQEVSLDFKKDKIEALLQYENPDCTIERVSASIDIENEKSSDGVEFLYENLPDGQYIVRALNMEGNGKKGKERKSAKEEEYGHTTLYIKENGNHYYYDPATGPIQLNNSSQLPMILDWQHARWNLPSIRFYKVGEKT